MELLENLIQPAYQLIHKQIIVGLIKGPRDIFLPHGRGSAATSFTAMNTIQDLEVRCLAQHLGDALVVCKGDYAVAESWDCFRWALDKLELNGNYVFCGNREMWRVDSTRTVRNKIKFVNAEDGNDLDLGDFRVVRLVISNATDFTEQDILKYKKLCPEYDTCLIDYNPDKHKSHWMNQRESENQVSSRDGKEMFIRGTYLTVPRPWLGGGFFHVAEIVRKELPEEYRHEYMGEPIVD